MRPTWRTLEVEGAAMRVMEAGEGEILLFLHGWGLSPRAYEAGIQRLAPAGIRVIAPALPGFGGSDGPGLREIALGTYAARISRLLDVLGVSHPVFVAGHSLGGGVALRLATDRPDQVRSLTLVNSVGGAPAQGGPLVRGSWLRWAVGATGELSPRGLLHGAPSLLRDFVPNAVRKPLSMLLSARMALRASLAEEAAAIVATGLPVLFVWGDRDRLIAPGALADVVSELPAEIVHGRHGWLLTEPEEFATLLREALVVHAMLERRRRGQSLVLPMGHSLLDLIPQERRGVARPGRA